MLLHVDFLAIAPVIASIVPASVLVAAITTAASAATASIASIVIVAGARLPLRGLGSALLLDHFCLDLVLSLHILALSLELRPAKRLILQHVLDELLDALANCANTLPTCLRVLPDGPEVV